MFYGLILSPGIHGEIAEAAEVLSGHSATEEGFTVGLVLGALYLLKKGAEWVYSFYNPSAGNPNGAVIKELKEIRKAIDKIPNTLKSHQEEIRAALKSLDEKAVATNTLVGVLVNK